MPICLLVRHGHSSANAAGVLAGWSDGVALTERGTGQARSLATGLAGIPLVRVVTSPLLRCRQTAELLTGPDHPAPVVDDALGECRYGAWTGRPLTELAGDPLWSTVQRDPVHARFPDGEEFPGESMADMATRMWESVRRHDREVAAEHGKHAVWAAVSHGDPIKSLVAEAGGGGLAHIQRIHVDPASVSVLRFDGDAVFVLASNRGTDGLAELVAAPTEEVPEGDAVVGGGAG